MLKFQWQPKKPEEAGPKTSTTTPESFRDGCPPEFKAFFQSLCFLPLASLDKDGRPWISMLSGTDGRRGFCTPGEGGGGRGGSRLGVSTWLHPGDVLKENLRDGKMLGGRKLVAGVGLELLNRRRNKMAGHIEGEAIPPEGDRDNDGEWKMVLDIENVLGYVFGLLADGGI